MIFNETYQKVYTIVQMFLNVSNRTCHRVVFNYEHYIVSYKMPRRNIINDSNEKNTRIMDKTINQNKFIS